MVNTASLAGGFEYSDCFFSENDAGFSFSFIRKVLQHGGYAMNYMELISADWRDGIWHCALRDHVAGEAFGVRARTLVNAAGPYADRINAMLGIQSRFRHIFSEGAHIIVPQVTSTRHVLTFFASDGRLFFMIPMGDRTCIGTTDRRVETIVDTPSPADVDFLLDNANTLLKLETPLTRDDIISTRCGVRPLVVRREDNVGDEEWTALSRKHEIDVHAERKVLTIYGGKLTDCLNVGEEAAEIVESFGIALDRTHDWFGEEPEAPDHDSGGKIIGNYGRRELERMARAGMVVHLEDFVRRRTLLELTRGRTALKSDPGLREASRILFGEKAEAELGRYAGSSG
jgi:glycerol-3-phosphate dehydrogenase